MSLFSPPPKPEKPTPPPPRGERGTRGVRYQPVEPPEGEKPKRRVRKNDRLKGPHNGFLCGNPQRGFYDLDGHYVRKRGRSFIVERFGPRAALNALTEEDRARVMRARVRDCPSRQVPKAKRRPNARKDP